MKQWNERIREVAYLLNPAFCARLLYTTIKEYDDKSQKPMPFACVYLVLPLVLHKSTRERINSRTHLLQWIQKNQDILIGYANRAKDLVPITNEAVELLLQSGLIELDTDGMLKIVKGKRSLSKTKYSDPEITECIKKSEHVARWFAGAESVTTIYISLGVRP